MSGQINGRGGEGLIRNVPFVTCELCSEGVREHILDLEVEGVFRISEHLRQRIYLELCVLNKKSQFRSKL